MCDYSRHVDSRLPKVGDMLISTQFPWIRGRCIRGFSFVNARDIAACLLPNTRLVFEGEEGVIHESNFWPGGRRTGIRDAQVCKFKPSRSRPCLDALDIRCGNPVPIGSLVLNLLARVVEIPKGKVVHATEVVDVTFLPPMSRLIVGPSTTSGLLKLTHVR